MISFVLPECEILSNGEVDPEDSWVFNPRADRLNWLALQCGPRFLLKSTAAYLRPAVHFLGQIFLGLDDDS